MKKKKGWEINFCHIRLTEIVPNNFRKIKKFKKSNINSNNEQKTKRRRLRGIKKGVLRIRAFSWHVPHLFSKNNWSRWRSTHCPPNNNNNIIYNIIIIMTSLAFFLCYFDLIVFEQFAFLIEVISLLGQQQQFHAFAFGQRPFIGGHFGNPLDPLQRATDPLAFRMPAMPNCQSRYYPHLLFIYPRHWVCFKSKDVSP